MNCSPMASGAVSPWRQYLGARRLLLTGILIAGAAAWCLLGLRPSQLRPSEGGWEIAQQFLAAALHPALDYESPPTAGVAPFLVRIARGCFDTLRFAGAAVFLSTVFGFILGFFASTAWWSGEARGGRLRRLMAPAVYSLVRVFITLCRSVHELIWALLLLAALGLTPMAAVIAITIPYSGTLAKVFSELIDEMPCDTFHALRAAGASPLRAYLLGLVPRALPDLFSYILYRFECGMRSATVLSFMGFSTIGLYLQQSFDNSDYREAWTCLYAMLGMVLFFDAWSAAIRRRINAGGSSRKASPSAATAADLSPVALRRERPRDGFLRFSLWCLAVLGAASLVTGFLLEIRWSGNVHGLGGLFAAEEVRWAFAGSEWERRMANLQRFLGEITPAPLLYPDAVTWRQWLGGIARTALPAALATLWISVLSIVLAAVAAWVVLPPVSRTVAVAQPWLKGGRRPPRFLTLTWEALRQAVKLFIVLSRAIPEVILAFIFLAIFGGNIWPAVLALAVHNFGILGRLGAETIDNAPQDTAAALRAAGASRLSILGLAVFPSLLPRFLIYFFYRWETCLRETTALGILGCATLGKLIRDVNSRFRYDEMMVLILTGAAIVVAGDFFSAMVRRWTRRAV
jgi:phosphonate transport system permease protein